MEELAKLKKEPAVDRATKKNAFKTPPPKISAPSPKQKSKVSPESPPRPMSSRGPDATQSEPATEAARLARLRRVCEIKPLGRCHVPKDVHERWLKGTNQERLAMADELEASGWAKDRSNMIKYYLVDCIFLATLLIPSLVQNIPCYIILYQLIMVENCRTCSWAASPRPSPRPTSSPGERNVDGTPRKPCRRSWDGARP